MRALAVYNVLALAACGVLGTWAWQEWHVPSKSPPEPVELTSLVETAGVPAPEPAFRMPPPKNTFAQLVTRPPFSPSRRPPRAKAVPTPVVQKPEAPSPAPVAAPQVTLVGIVINAGKSMAMVRKPGAEELLRLGKGEVLDGWQVEGVLPDRLVLSHGEKLLELELTEAAQGQGPAGSSTGTEASGRQRRP